MDLLLQSWWVAPAVATDILHAQKLGLSPRFSAVDHGSHTLPQWTHVANGNFQDLWTVDPVASRNPPKPSERVGITYKLRYNSYGRIHVGFNQHGVLFTTIKHYDSQCLNFLCRCDCSRTSEGCQFQVAFHGAVQLASHGGGSPKS